MTTALLSHPSGLNHVTPPGHPEQVARLASVLDALDGVDVLRVEPPEATARDVELAHPPGYFEAILAKIPQDGMAALDPDTFLSATSREGVLRAAGAVIKAVNLVMAGEAQNAFCAMRPPGHHAEAETPMGVCFFGNVAIGAKHALARHGLERVAVVDFDVHHGNGTQDLLWDEGRAFFASTHQSPLYPGTGAPHERGAHGNILNCPLPSGADGLAFRKVMERDVLPAVEAFAPQMLFISAGFDAHRADPLANLNLEVADFEWATEALCALAAEHCEGRVVSVLEGGYDLPALGACARAHVDALRRASA
ncbi:MAG: histone deacetylase family protein [Pseudomonadota bacterium]